VFCQDPAPASRVSVFPFRFMPRISASAANPTLSAWHGHTAALMSCHVAEGEGMRAGWTYRARLSEWACAGTKFTEHKFCVFCNQLCNSLFGIKFFCVFDQLFALGDGIYSKASDFFAKVTPCVDIPVIPIVHHLLRRDDSFNSNACLTVEMLNSDLFAF
jgi:hypothetical protein